MQEPLCLLTVQDNTLGNILCLLLSALPLSRFLSRTSIPLPLVILLSTLPSMRILSMMDQLLVWLARDVLLLQRLVGSLDPISSLKDGVTMAPFNSAAAIDGRAEPM